MPRYAQSVAAVARVQRLDGRSLVTGTYRSTDTGWERPPLRLLLTEETLRELVEQGVRTVRLRRGWRTGQVPLIWFRKTQRPPTD